MSGTATAISAGAPTQKTFFDLSEKIGCGGRQEGAKIIECMRQIPAKAILKGIEGLSPVGPIGAILLFMPVRDEKTVFSDYAARGAAGNFIKRPVLVGNTDNEMGLVRGLYAATLAGYAARGGVNGLLATMALAGINYVLSSPYVQLAQPFTNAPFACT
jgi:hypothetical protein